MMWEIVVGLIAIVGCLATLGKILANLYILTSTT